MLSYRRDLAQTRIGSRATRRFPAKVIVMAATAVTALAMLDVAVTPPPLAHAAVATPERGSQLGTALMATSTDETLIENLSTSMTNTYLEPGGSYRLQSYTAPVNYRDDAGEWRPIDNKFVDAPGSTYAVENAANDYMAQIPTDPSTTPVKFSVDGGWVTMRMHGVNDSPEIEDSKAEFEGVAGASSVVYTATSEGLKEDIVLDAAPIASDRGPSYTYTLVASAGLVPVMTAQNAVEFQNGAGDVVVTIPPGTMTDSATPTSSVGVDYNLVQSGGAWRLKVTPSLEWLSDPARVYPVKIDPSLTDQSDTQDCWLNQSLPTNAYCGVNQSYLRSGRSGAGGKRRSLIDFDVSSIPSTAKIDTATVSLYLDSTQTLNANSSADYAFYRAGRTWNNAASWNSSGSSAWINGGGDPVGAAYGQKHLVGSSSGYKDFDGLAAIIQGWVDGTYSRTGMVVKQVGETTDHAVAFLSRADATGTKRPYLIVGYTNMPSVPTRLAVSPSLGDVDFVSSASPTVGAVVAVPGGGSLSARFQVRDDANALVWSATTAAVASGSLATVTIPAGVLSNNTSYTVSASSSNSAGMSPWSNGVAFTTAIPLDFGSTMDDAIDPFTPLTSEDEENLIPDPAEPADPELPIGNVDDNVIAAIPNWEEHPEFDVLLSSNSNLSGLAASKGIEVSPSADTSPETMASQYPHTKYATWGACGNFDKSLKIIRTFDRKFFPGFVGAYSYLNCGDPDKPSFGFWHISLPRGKSRPHSEEWGDKSAYLADPQWRHAADFGMRWALRLPELVVKSRTGNFCMSRRIYIYGKVGDVVEEKNRYRATVWVGATGRRIISSYPSHSWCQTDPVKGYQVVYDIRQAS